MGFFVVWKLLFFGDSRVKWHPSKSLTLKRYHRGWVYRHMFASRLGPLWKPILRGFYKEITKNRQKKQFLEVSQSVCTLTMPRNWCDSAGVPPSIRVDRESTSPFIWASMYRWMDEETIQFSKIGKLTCFGIWKIFILRKLRVNIANNTTHFIANTNAKFIVVSSIFLLL